MLTLLGLLIGLAIGVTGVGGGVLTAPLLILFFHMPPGPGVGTALLFSTGVKVLSAGMFTARRQVHARTLLLLLAGGVPGAIAGPLLLRRFAPGQASPWVLMVVGATVCATAGYSLLRVWAAPRPRQERSAWLPLFSFPIGLEVGFSSAGAGALGTVLLFNQTNLEPAKVVGTDLVFGLAVSACAGGMHLAAGNWDAGVLVKLLSGGVFGALLGAQLAGRFPARPLRAIILSWAAVLGLLLAWQGLQKAI
jgi:uncharacterized membrane protein YfcA